MPSPLTMEAVRDLERGGSRSPRRVAHAVSRRSPRDHDRSRQADTCAALTTQRRVPPSAPARGRAVDGVRGRRSGRHSGGWWQRQAPHHAHERTPARVQKMASGKAGARAFTHRDTTSVEQLLEARPSTVAFNQWNELFGKRPALAGRIATAEAADFHLEHDRTVSDRQVTHGAGVMTLHRH